MADLAPIVLFVYNRPLHTRQTLETLSKNVLAEQSLLYIYSDGAKENSSQADQANIQQVRELLKERNWCGKIEVIEQTKNLGLAASVIKGVTEVVQRHGRVIVLEDDLLTNRGFLSYMNAALEYYKDKEKVACISGFSFPGFDVHGFRRRSFFLRTGATWGWATWERGWKAFNPDPTALKAEILETNNLRDFNFNNSLDYLGMLEAQISGKIDSWGIRWYASIFNSGRLTSYPPKTYVVNIGMDGTGTHYKIKGPVRSYDNTLLTNEHSIRFSDKIRESFVARKLFEKYLRRLAGKA